MHIQVISETTALRLVLVPCFARASHMIILSSPYVELELFMESDHQPAAKPQLHFTSLATVQEISQKLFKLESWDKKQNQVY